MISSYTKHILLAILCALSICCTATAASTYPAQASVQVIKPSVYLEDYGDGFDERVSVVLLCRDAMSAGVQVRLRLTIKCQNGVTLRTKSHAVFSPITLYHGTPDRLGAAELAPYFDARNLDVTGSLVNGAMPEGVAQFSVEVLEYYTGVPLSLPASTVTNLTLARPPTLLFPRNGATLRFSEPLSLIFSWSVRSSIAAGDSYEFLLKEIADTNANTTSAFNYSQTIFRTETFATSIVYSVSEPPLEPGKTYAWCVRLMNSHAVNGGWSEVFTFRLDETEGVDGGEQSADAVSEPKRRSGECGEDSYRVTDLTPCDTPLSVGDTMTVGGGFPVIVREITQRSERFYGRGLMYVPYIGVSFAVSINGVRVNCLKQMIEGYTEVEHDASHSQIGGTDALLHGGATKLKNGVVMPDLAVDFTFPEGMKAALDSDAGTLVFYDTGGNVAGSVEMPRNEQGEPVFPVRVKDADGEIVQIDKAGDEGSEEGELTVTHIGKANSSELVHPRVTAYLRPDYGVVEFGDADDSRFSFDAALPYYESVAILLNSDGAGGGGRVYRKMNGNYIVPWKFLSTGSTDKVTAKLTLTDEGKKLIKPEKLQFKTVTEAGTVTLPSDYDASTGLYTVQVTAAQPDSRTSVFALYPYNGTDDYLNLGVIDIDTRSTLEAKVCIVDLGGSANIHHIETELNAIYSKVGVHWSVTRESGFSYPKDSIAHLFDSRSKALELYNSHQKNLNRAFETYLGNRYDGKTCYLFMMPANGSGSKRELAGFMPRGEQYGYINTDAVKSENLPAVIAHELGHGKYRLRHTFDSEYGSAAERKKGGTDNLMDYASSPYKSTHIAKWQWMQIHDPALLTEVWEKDEDSEWVVQDYIQKLQRIIDGGLKDVLKENISNGTVETGHIMLEVIMNSLLYYHSTIGFENIKLSELKQLYDYITSNNSQWNKFFVSIGAYVESDNPSIDRLCELSKFFTSTMLPDNVIKECETLTQQLIDTNKSEYEVILGLLFEFKYGIGPMERTFDENSVLTKNLKDFYLVENLRTRFYEIKEDIIINSHGQGIEDAFRGLYFPIYGNLKSWTDLTEQYVGGFYAEMYSTSDKDIIEIKIYNDVNLKSLVAHYFYINELLNDIEIFPERYYRLQNNTPLGETRQIFIWKEDKR